MPNYLPTHRYLSHSANPVSPMGLAAVCHSPANPIPPMGLITQLQNSNWHAVHPYLSQTCPSVRLRVHTVHPWGWHQSRFLHEADVRACSFVKLTLEPVRPWGWHQSLSVNGADIRVCPSWDWHQSLSVPEAGSRNFVTYIRVCQPYNIFHWTGNLKGAANWRLVHLYLSVSSCLHVGTSKCLVADHIHPFV